MNKFFGSIFLLAFAVFLSTNISSAEEAKTSPSADFSYTTAPKPGTAGTNSGIESNALTPISVIDLKIEKTKYNAGDTVVGTVSLNNRINTDQTDVYLDISLVGDYSTAQGRYNLPDTIYDTKSFGPFNAKAGGVTNVPLSYTMPKNIGGLGLGIEVSARSVSGLPYGWQEARLEEVKGGKTILTIKNAYTNVDGTKHTLGSGPTIRATSTIDFHLNVTNPSAGAITVTPTIEIHDRLISGKLIKKYTEKTVTIASKASYDFVVKPFMNEGVPGVYVADVSLLDGSGNSLAPSTAYRYILPGAIATIQEVNLDQKTVKRGELVNVAVSYSGPPFDIITGEREKIVDAVLSVQILDAKTNAVLGENSTKPDFTKEMNISEVPVKVKSSASSIVAVTTISAQGKVLSTYTTSATLPDLEKVKEIENASGPTRLILLISVVVAIILSLFYFLRKRNLNKKLLITIIATFSVVSGGLVYISQVQALHSTNTTTRYAQTYTRCDYPPPGSPWTACVLSTGVATSYLALSQPSPSATSFAPGDTITVQGNIISTGCFNTPETVHIYVAIYNTQTWEQVGDLYSYAWDYQNCPPGSGCSPASRSNTSYFSFNIPQNLPAGDYSVIVRTLDWWQGNPQWSTYADEWYKTDIHIALPELPSPPPTPTGLTVSSGSCSAGSQPVNLSWNPSFDGRSYQIYRSTSSSGPFGADQKIGYSFTTSYSDNLSLGTTYYYKVSAVNLYGESGQSSPAVSITTPSACGECTGTPWGTMLNGASNTAYLSSSVTAPSTCTPETRTCTNGVLSGSYLNLSCTVTPITPPVTPPTTVTTGGGGAHSIVGLAKCENVNTTPPTSTSTVSLSWKAATTTGTIRYEIFRGSTSIGSNISGLSFTDPTPQTADGSSLSYKVRTTNGTVTIDSPTVSVRTPSNCLAPIVGSVSVNSFTATPPLGNPPFTCHLSWELGSFSSNSLCTLTGPQGFDPVVFKPAGFTGTDAYNVWTESQYGLSCREGSGTATAPRHATCRINPNLVEIP